MAAGHPPIIHSVLNCLVSHRLAVAVTGEVSDAWLVRQAAAGRGIVTALTTQAASSMNGDEYRSHR